tara:strand:- start:239 stop:454 length:216 start_codon:yes stop_codon:yes gene_type:complete
MSDTALMYSSEEAQYAVKKDGKKKVLRGRERMNVEERKTVPRYYYTMKNNSIFTFLNMCLLQESTECPHQS